MTSWRQKAATLRSKLVSSDRDRGDAARDRRDWLAAVEAYETHLERHPDDGAIWVQLGHASKENGNLDEGLAAYRHAEQLLGDDADLQLSLGHVFKRMGAVEAAMAAYRRSAELSPGLFAGEAVVQIEIMHGRRTWNRADAGLRDVPGLLEAVDVAERDGHALFADYFRSFGMR